MTRERSRPGHFDGRASRADAQGRLRGAAGHDGRRRRRPGPARRGQREEPQQQEHTRERAAQESPSPPCHRRAHYCVGSGRRRPLSTRREFAP
jgi:hypothetical protein